MRKKAYEKGKVGFFAVFTDNMEEDRLEFWPDRELEDEKMNFQSVLLTALDREEEMEAIEEELDRQPNNAFYILNMNPAGIVNIKIVRDADDKIIRAEYLTEEEI